MTIEELEELIVTQGRRIPLLDWELGLLIKDCNMKKCLPKGLAILYEYAGYLDTVKRLIDIRHESAVALFDQAAKFSTEDHEILALLENLANVNINLLINMGNLRALQWSPRSVLTPVTVPLRSSSEDSNTNNYTELLHEQTMSGKRVPLESCLKAEALHFQRVFNHTLKKIPGHCSVILLAPEFEYEVIVKSLAEDGAALGDYQSLARAISNIVGIEDDISMAYKVIRTSVKSGRGKHGASPYNELPTLRLNYPDFVPNATYQWFGKALEVYSPSVVTLVATQETQSIPRTRLSTRNSKKASPKKDNTSYQIVYGANESKEVGQDQDPPVLSSNESLDPFAESGQMIISNSSKNITVPLPNSVSDQLERPQTSAGILEPSVPKSDEDHSNRVQFKLSASNPGTPISSPIVPVIKERRQRSSQINLKSSPLGAASKHSNSSGFGRAQVGAEVMIKQEPTALPAPRMDYNQSPEEANEEIFQTSPVSRLAGPLQSSEPIEVDYTYIGAGGIGSGAHTGSPSKGDKKGKGSSPSKKPDIKKGLVFLRQETLHKPPNLAREKISKPKIVRVYKPIKRLRKGLRGSRNTKYCLQKPLRPFRLWVWPLGHLLASAEVRAVLKAKFCK